ncbi:Aste57867_21512 [Aphanomyces stellatus]|uniref:Aste57867_21512 protein n=1 Tax=Aphanomyces stellatus TaxID=120398 RepID=A0A485LIZ8_9STRA|nr:hypothetical protein As57867_021443 [Aphanomyces stellatus]VFT98182.1 Aste57867_21512 [Aphanomyces stellatus]
MASSPTASRRQPRISVTDDLVAWHGMTVKNFTVMVANGIPLTTSRRQIWLDIISTELKRRSKAKLSVSFAAYVGTMWEQGSGAFGILTEKLDSSFRSHGGASKKSARSQRASKTMDQKFIDDVVLELNDSAYVVVDHQTAPFVDAVIRVVAPEVRNRSEVVKVLSFLLHVRSREQLARNTKPCIPHGDVGPICLDTIESTVLMLLPSVHSAIMQLGLPRREIYWKLLLLSLQSTFPSEIRLRMIDHILVNGCAALVSTLLVYLQRRQHEILLCTTIEAFEALHEGDYHEWLQQNQFDAFWKECIEVHKSNFNQVYIARNIFMRAKHFTFNMESSVDRYLPYHNELHVVDLDQYGWVGFDVDHTLVEFKLEVLLRASFEKAHRHIQANYMNLRTCPPPVWIPHLAFRGLAVDTRKGNLLHVGSDGHVLRGFHGTFELSSNVLALYYPKADHRLLSTRLNSSSSPSHAFRYLYTNAEIIYGPLYAWLVDQYEKSSITNVEIGYVPLTEEHKKDMQFLHPESVYSLLSSIVLDATTAYYGSEYWRTLSTTPEVLIQVNTGIRRLLEHLQKPWKKNIFLLTNGGWEHTDVVMRAAIGKDWRSFFDLVLTKASKDVFFETCHAARFREVLTLHNARSITAATTLDRGKVYEGGNITELMHALHDPKWKLYEKPKVLFMGDHPLHDIVNPTQSATPWDTVAVIHESNLLFKHLEKHHRKKHVQTAIQLVLDTVFACTSARRGPQVETRPAPSTSCFYFDSGGPYSALGKLINRHAILCVDSVARLTQQENTIQTLLQSRLERRRESARISGPLSSTGVVTSKVQHQWSNIFRTNAANGGGVTALSGRDKSMQSLTVNSRRGSTS